MITDERYVAFTTFKTDGTPKPVPVWPVDAGDGRIGFVTSSKTWKVKRLVNNNRVEVQPSDYRGRVKADTKPVSATAEVVGGSEFDALNLKVRAKYGFQLKLVNVLHALPRLIGRTGHPNDRAIIVTLDEH